MAQPRTVEFYFDPISPYSWLAAKQCARVEAAGVRLVFRPVLFAGLLSAHGSTGPAEIAAKRAYAMRHYSGWYFVLRKLRRNCAGSAASPSSSPPIVRSA